MFEVTLVKRFFVLMLVVLIALAATACTRDKPPEPTPDLRIVVSSSSSSASASSSASSISSSVAFETPSAASSSSATSASSSSATSVPTVAPTLIPTPTTSTPGTYTVKWGDWLNKIAAEHGVTVQAILAVNPGLNPNLIYPGQVINLPTGGGSSSSSSSSASSSTSASGTPSTYTVQRGDWIYAIARKFNVSVAALLAANPGIRPNLLYPGQQLNIPGGDSSGTTPPSAGTYVVKPGDTLFSIAVKFRTTVYAFQIKNNLANPHFIYPGQVLIVPQ